VRIIVLLVLFAAMPSGKAMADCELLGPIPYLHWSDSPFADAGLGELKLEDFEDQFLDLEGVTLSPGVVSSLWYWPGHPLIDSVDGDDGNPADEGCAYCDSYYYGTGSIGVTIEYDADSQGIYPKHCGVVWTDGAGDVFFDAWDSAGLLIDTIGPYDLSDGNHAGGTSEDSFFGVICDEGVSKICIRNTSGGIEIDHVQYIACPDGYAYEECRDIESAGMLFGERYARDAGSFGPAGPPAFFDSTKVTITKSPGDQFFLSGHSARLESLISDDEVFIASADSFVGVGLGPYEIYNSEFDLCRPIGDFLRPVGALDITELVPAGTNCIEFRLGDTQREIYGNTEIYLLRIPEGSSVFPEFTRTLISYPNPFNPQTTIAFDLPIEMLVDLRVYDIAGRLVDVLINDEMVSAGSNEVVWHGRDMSGRQLPSGTYFYRLTAGVYSETRRMVLVK